MSWLKQWNRVVSMKSNIEWEKKHSSSERTYREPITWQNQSDLLIICKRRKISLKRTNFPNFFLFPKIESMKILQLFIFLWAPRAACVHRFQFIQKQNVLIDLNADNIFQLNLKSQKKNGLMAELQE